MEPVNNNQLRECILNFNLVYSGVFILKPLF